MVRKGRGTKWLYSVLPANIAYGPISTLVTLYILHLGGNVIDVAYAITLGSAASILSSFFWGKVSDAYNRKKFQIILSYLGLCVSLLALIYIKSVIGVALAYVFLTFMFGANGTPLNLLVMESAPKEKWGSTFSSLQMISGVGGTIGFIIAAVVVNFVPEGSLLLLLLLMALLSIFMTVRLVSEPHVNLAAKKFLSDSITMISRLFVYPILVVLMPRPQLVRKILDVSSIRNWKSSHLSVLFAAGFVFYLGTGFFNTAYPAGLYNFGLPESYVFLVLFVGLLVQTITFHYSGPLIERGSKLRIIHQSIRLRGVCYVLVGVTFLAINSTAYGAAFLWLNIVLYLLAAGVAFAMYYATSYMLVFESINSMERGKSLGIYTALVSLGSLLGAFFSGYTSHYVGYWLTFAVGGALILLSAQLFKQLHE